MVLMRRSIAGGADTRCRAEEMGLGDGAWERAEAMGLGDRAWERAEEIEPGDRAEVREAAEGGGG